jgi:hypothetical protein
MCKRSLHISKQSSSVVLREPAPLHATSLFLALVDRTAANSIGAASDVAAGLDIANPNVLILVTAAFAAGAYVLMQKDSGSFTPATPAMNEGSAYLLLQSAKSGAYIYHSPSRVRAVPLSVGSAAAVRAEVHAFGRGSAVDYKSHKQALNT